MKIKLIKKEVNLVTEEAIIHRVSIAGKDYERNQVVCVEKNDRFPFPVVTNEVKWWKLDKKGFTTGRVSDKKGSDALESAFTKKNPRFKQ